MVEVTEAFPMFTTKTVINFYGLRKVFSKIDLEVDRSQTIE